MPVRATIAVFLAGLAAAESAAVYFVDEDGLGSFDLPGKVPDTFTYLVQDGDICGTPAFDSEGSKLYYATCPFSANSVIKSVTTADGTVEDVVTVGAVVSGGVKLYKTVQGLFLIYFTEDDKFHKVTVADGTDEVFCDASGKVTVPSFEQFDWLTDLTAVDNYVAWYNKADQTVYKCNIIIGANANTPEAVGAPTTFTNPGQTLALGTEPSTFYVRDPSDSVEKIYSLKADGTGAWTERFNLDPQDLRVVPAAAKIIIDSANDQFYWYEPGSNSEFTVSRRKLSDTGALVAQPVFETAGPQYQEKKLKAFVPAWLAVGGTPADGDFASPCNPAGRCTGYSGKADELGRGQCLLDATAEAGFSCDCSYISKVCNEQEVNGVKEDVCNTWTADCCRVGATVLDKGEVDCGVYFPDRQGGGGGGGGGDGGGGGEMSQAAHAAASLLPLVLGLLVSVLF